MYNRIQKLDRNAGAYINAERERKTDILHNFQVSSISLQFFAKGLLDPNTEKEIR